MITALDTSVLLDVFSADETYGPSSREAVQACLAEGSLIACSVVWAEVAAAFEKPERAEAAMSQLGVGFDAIERVVALEAGSVWRAYRSRGDTRTRVIADFLIGAHAHAGTDRLLTRDRGFYRSYFKKLSILDPTQS